jgi:hypothetical protein
MEALYTKDHALRIGAESNLACRRAIAAADATLLQVELGIVTGAAACKKAAVAVHKYNSAAEGVCSTTRQRKAVLEAYYARQRSAKRKRREG